jgi:hypothetical protein
MTYFRNTERKRWSLSHAAAEVRQPCGAEVRTARGCPGDPMAENIEKETDRHLPATSELLKVCRRTLCQVNRQS